MVNYSSDCALLPHHSFISSARTISSLVSRILWVSLVRAGRQVRDGKATSSALPEARNASVRPFGDQSGDQVEVLRQRHWRTAPGIGTSSASRRGASAPCGPRSSVRAASVVRCSIGRGTVGPVRRHVASERLKVVLAGRRDGSQVATHQFRSLSSLPVGAISSGRMTGASGCASPAPGPRRRVRTTPRALRRLRARRGSPVEAVSTCTACPARSATTFR